MSTSIKLKNNNYIDTSGITHNRQILKDKLLLPYVLYEGHSKENINLSDSASNYQYIEIYYTDIYQTMYNCCKIFAPNGKNGLLILAWRYDDEGGGTQTIWKNVEIRNGAINNGAYSNFNVQSGGVWSGVYNSIYIDKVVGYK